MNNSTQRAIKTNVIMLPTAAAVPIGKQPYKRLPAGIASMSRARAARALNATANDDAYDDTRERIGVLKMRKSFIEQELADLQRTVQLN